MRGERTACNYEAIAADLTDSDARAALWSRLGANCGNALVVTEGLLIYLDTEQVAGLGRWIHEMRCAALVAARPCESAVASDHAAQLGQDGLQWTGAIQIRARRGNRVLLRAWLA
jgi:O-methyltransferase involved in polyketide biosynthesis